MAREVDRSRRRATSAKHPLKAPKNKKKSKKKARKDPVWTKVLIVLGALFMLISGGTIIGVKSVIAKVEDSFQQKDLLGNTAQEPPKGNLPDGPITMLMVGIDVRPGRDLTKSRADTIIIAHIPASREVAYLMSVPRDLMVDAAPFPKSGFGGGRLKMNETFFAGGQGDAGLAGSMEMLARSIKDTLGITFDAAAVINFSSFKKVVEALGGVNMCIDQDVTSKHIRVDSKGNPHDVEGNLEGTEHIGKRATYKKGECRRFKPWEALDYSRQRYGLENGDYDRQRHQLQLIKAILDEAASKGIVTNPPKIYELIEAAGEAFVTDTRGVPVTDFALGLSGIGANLIPLRTNEGRAAGKMVDGKWYETLTPESAEMFEAVSANTLDQFIFAHPEYLASGFS